MRFGLLGALLAWLAILVLGPGPVGAQTESRVALVIGNGSYQSVPALRNPARDARAMAATLRRFGFEVVQIEDATRRAMIDALAAFQEKLAAGGVGLVFYAGHGVQAGGVNYLLPVDARIANESDLRYEALDAQDVLARMEAARVRLALVILDACRDNPFAGKFRSLARGLARLDAADGALIAYATAPGMTAADGTGANGLYTAELLKAMAVPGLPVEEVFKRTAAGVARASNNRQTPWISSSFRGEFYFQPPAAAERGAPAPREDGTETLYWSSIKDSSDPAEYEAYLARYPNGQFAELARARVQRLRDRRATPAPAVAPARPATAPPRPAAAPAPPPPATGLRDCPDCPEMVVLPGGRFDMGAGPASPGARPAEGPQHAVGLRGFAISRYEVTREEFAVFAAETGFRPDRGCHAWTGSGWQEQPDLNWRNPGYPQTARDPVVCVSWDDAVAYADWLGRRTGRRYRLPSEAEWEYAARAGTRTAQYWGDRPTAACAHANVADRAARQRFSGFLIHDCDDGQVFTAPVGRYRPNAFGLHDMLGNALEWVADCWNDSYVGAPEDGSAWLAGDCRHRILRGGSWFDDAGHVRAPHRGRSEAAIRGGLSGFRVVREE